MFSWKYDRDRDQLVTLYNKAMASQWDSINDLDWSIEVDPERLVQTSSQANVTVELARAAKDVAGSPFANWGEKEFTDLGIESLKASLSQFMHGEQGSDDGCGEDRGDGPVDRCPSTTRRPRPWTRRATPRSLPSTSTRSSVMPTR